MLGHASITTTQVYTHIADQQLRDVHKAFHWEEEKILTNHCLADKLGLLTKVGNFYFKLP